MAVIQSEVSRWVLKTGHVTTVDAQFAQTINHIHNEKSAQRDANTARCSKVRTPPSSPPVANTQTGPITIHCAAS